MNQLSFPFFKPSTTHKQKSQPKSIAIPFAAAVTIFNEVFDYYEHMLEANTTSALVVNFRVDVEACLKKLYPLADDYLRARTALLKNPQSRPATRTALATAFLFKGLWPVKSYFSR